MIGSKYNMDEVFFRDLTVCLLDTLEGRLNWINRFTSGDIEVSVPMYYSMTGDERFLLDSFQDDIVSENRKVELNTDQIPRGHLTLNSLNVRSDEFRNPNIWLRSVVEDDVEIRNLLKQTRAIPITVVYDLVILLKSEIDVFRCSQEILNTLWLYKFMYFEHNHMNIDAVFTMPDTNSIEITREKNLKSDNNIKLTIPIEVQTYYPSFTENESCKIDTVASSVCSVDDDDTSVISVGPIYSKSCKGSSKKVSNLSEVKVGYQVIGDNIPNGVYVREIDLVNSKVVISKNIKCGLINSPVTFLNDSGIVYPYRTRWFSNLYPLNSRSIGDRNPNSNDDDLNNNKML